MIARQTVLGISFQSRRLVLEFSMKHLSNNGVGLNFGFLSSVNHDHECRKGVQRESPLDLEI